MWNLSTDKIDGIFLNCPAFCVSGPCDGAGTAKPSDWKNVQNAKNTQKPHRTHKSSARFVSPFLDLETTNFIHFLNEISAEFNIFPVNQLIYIILDFLD